MDLKRNCENNEEVRKHFSNDIGGFLRKSYFRILFYPPHKFSGLNEFFVHSLK